MPLSTDAKDELKKLEDKNIKLQPLRDRQDNDFEKFCGKQFKIDPKEGKWENVTSNRAQWEGWKITTILGSASRRLSILVSDEKAEQKHDKLPNPLQLDKKP